MSSLIPWIAAFAYALWLPLPAPAQTSGSISGHALAADGRPVRGFVVLQPLPAAGSHARPLPPQRAFTDAKGAFQFTVLPAAQYTLCTSPLPAQGRTKQEVLLDTCEWARFQTVTLAAGQTLPPLTLTVPAGALFQVHVDDPERKLPQSGKGPSDTSPAPPDPQLIVLLKGPDRLLHHVPMTGRALAARDHSMVIPSGTALSLIVRSKQFGVLDPAGRAFSGELPVAASLAGATPTSVTVTVQGGRP